MEEGIETAQPSPKEAIVTSEQARRQKYLWIETSVVILACLGTSLFYNGAIADGVTSGGSAWGTDIYENLYDFVRQASRIALVLFIIWRSGDPFARFGIKAFSAGRDITIGVIVYAAVIIAQRIFWWGMHPWLSQGTYKWLSARHYQGSYTTGSVGPAEYIVLALKCAAVGMCEELVARGYLISRFEELFDSTPIAVMLTTVLFACMHAYQGNHGMVGSAIFAIMMAAVFCRFRRLWPVAIAHAIYDFVVFAGIPLP